jgi:error-prone DNA polymerase
MTGGGHYVERQCTSRFSFLRGASSCEELFAQAAVMGIEAMAIVDRTASPASSALIRPPRRPAWA